MNRFARPWLLVAVAALTFGGVGRLVAEEKGTEEEKESREAEDEVKAEMEKLGTDQLPSTMLTGILQLSPSPDIDPTKKPIGTFSVSGTSYQVKLADAHVKSVLMENNGKTVSLVGQLRNKNKYFVVERLVSTTKGGSGVGLTKRKRGGM